MEPRIERPAYKNFHTHISGFESTYNSSTSYEHKDAYDLGGTYQILTAQNSSQINGLDGLNGVHPGKVPLVRFLKERYYDEEQGYWRWTETHHELSGSQNLEDYVEQYHDGKVCEQIPEWERNLPIVPFTASYSSAFQLTVTDPNYIPDFPAGSYTAETTASGTATIGIDESQGFGAITPGLVHAVLFYTSLKTTYTGPTAEYNYSVDWLDSSQHFRDAPAGGYQSQYKYWGGLGFGTSVGGRTSFMDEDGWYPPTFNPEHLPNEFSLGNSFPGRRSNLVRLAGELNTDTVDAPGFIDPVITRRAGKFNNLLECRDPIGHLYEHLHGHVSGHLIYTNPDQSAEEGLINHDRLGSEYNVRFEDVIST